MTYYSPGRDAAMCVSCVPRDVVMFIEDQTLAGLEIKAVNNLVFDNKLMTVVVMVKKQR